MKFANKQYDFVQKMYDTINYGTHEEFVEFAKAYNIFQSGGTKFYQEMCARIKERLDREGLDYETVRPE